MTVHHLNLQFRQEHITNIRVRGVPVEIINERVQYYDKGGKLITESLKDYTKKNILGEYATLDEFLKAWTKAEKKQAIIEELEERGVLLDALKEESGKELDDFDLILHIAYDKKTLTKQERVSQVKKTGYLYKYSAVCQQVLSALLDKYMDQGVGELEDTRYQKIHLLIKLAALKTLPNSLEAKKDTSKQ